MSTLMITWNGESHPMKEWAEITGIPYETLKTRKRSGWDVEHMLTAPVRTKNNWVYYETFISEATVRARAARKKAKKVEPDELPVEVVRAALRQGIIPQRKFPKHCEPVRCSSGVRFGW